MLLLLQIWLPSIKICQIPGLMLQCSLSSPLTDRGFKTLQIFLFYRQCYQENPYPTYPCACLSSVAKQSPRSGTLGQRMWIFKILVRCSHIALQEDATI